MVLFKGWIRSWKKGFLEGVVYQYRVRKSPHYLCLLLVGYHTEVLLLLLFFFFFFFFVTEKNEAENLEENEEPFIAPLGLSVPSDVELVCVPPHWPCLLLFTMVHESVE
jgi:hypothetical protein